MAYTPATIGVSGLIIPTYQDIIAYLVAQYQQIYGPTVYLAPDSADYQDLAVRALQASDVNQAVAAVYLAFNPLYAIGPSLDLVGVLIGTARKNATFSTAQVTISGTSGTVITNGVAQDTSSNLWNLPGTVTIGLGGTIVVNATAQQIGVITANPGAINRIATPVAGWTGVTNVAAAVAGQPVEADSAYRARLLVAQTKPSLTLLAGTAAAVAGVSGVTRSVVYENDNGYTASYGFCNTSGTSVTRLTGYPFDSSMAGAAMIINGVSYAIASVGGASAVTLSSSAGSLTAANFAIGNFPSQGPKNSITTVVEGGSDTDVASAIYGNAGIGALTNGTTSVVITDPVNGNLSKAIGFDRLSYTAIYIGITVHPLAGWSTAVQAQIQTDLVNYLNSVGIGNAIIYGELYGAALQASANSSPTFSIRSLVSGTQAAATTATFSSGANTITVAVATNIANGQAVVGTGIAPGTTVSGVSGTTITLSANTTALGSSTPVTFFATGTVDIPINYDSAAQGVNANVAVMTV